MGARGEALQVKEDCPPPSRTCMALIAMALIAMALIAMALIAMALIAMAHFSRIASSPAEQRLPCRTPG